MEMRLALGNTDRRSVAAALAAFVLIPAAAMGGDGPLCEECLVGSLGCGDPVTADFPASTCLDDDGGAIDFWRVDVGETSVLDIRLASDDFDTFLVLDGGLCNRLAQNDDCGRTTDSCSSYLAGPGTYFIGVSSFFPGETGSYELEARCRPLDLCSCQVGEIRCGEPIDEVFPLSSCRAARDVPIDLWRFEIPQRGRVEISLGSGNFDTVLHLLDESCAPIAVNDDCQLTDSCLSADVEAGVYHIGVSSFTTIERGSFSLEVTCPDLDLCRDCRVGEVVCGEALGGSLGDESCEISLGTAADFWELRMPSRGRLRFLVASGEFDPVLQVFDEAHDLVASNDDCRGAALDSCLDLELDAGSYCVAVSSFFAGERGNYSLVPECLEGGFQLPGDCNTDGRVDISDGSCLLGHLFLGSPLLLPCGDGTGSHPSNRRLFDLNGDAAVDVSDPAAVFGFLFLGRSVSALRQGCVMVPECPASCVP